MARPPYNSTDPVFMDTRRNKQPKRRKTRARRRRARLPTVFRPFAGVPTSTKICLKGRTYESGSGSSPLYHRYGILEPLGYGGSYIETYLNGGLYKYGIAHANRITLRLVNMGSEPLILACAALPYSWTSASPTLSELMDHPTAIKATSGASTGQDKCVIVNSASAREVLGKEYQVARYQFDYTQAVSATPVVTTEPVWTVVVSAFNAATTVSYRLEVEFDWNFEFYNLDSF